MDLSSRGGRSAEGRPAEPRPSDAGGSQAAPRRPAGKAPAAATSAGDSGGPPPDGEAPVVDLFTKRVLSRPQKRALADKTAVLEGTVAARPVVLFCHIRGEVDPFPRKWRWGKLTIGSGRPVWQHLTWRGARETITMPEDVKQVEFARRILREELSAFCPNPRRTRIIPFETAGGIFLIGVKKANVETVQAAILPRARPRQRPKRTRPPGDATRPEAEASRVAEKSKPGTEAPLLQAEKSRPTAEQPRPEKKATPTDEGS